MNDWISDTKWENLDSDGIVEVLKRNSAGETEIRKVLDRLSVEGNKSGTTVLYSGMENTKTFTDNMRKAGCRIIDDTQAGKLLNNKSFNNYLKDALSKDVNVVLYDGKTGLWAQASKRFVASTVGKVEIYAGKGLRAAGVFLQTEIYEVINNKAITNINGKIRDVFFKDLKIDFNAIGDRELRRLKNVLLKSSSLQLSPAFGRWLKKIGGPSLSILAFSTTAATASELWDEGDRDGAIEVMYDYLVETVSGAAGAGMSNIAILKLLSCFAYQNPYVRISTTLIGAVFSAYYASKYGKELSDPSKEDIIKFIKDCSDWFISDKETLREEIGSDFTTASETRSPLVVDLDGDGVETVSVANGVYFDHDGNGFSEKTGWVSGDDGILVRDLNDNGQIDDGSELFGDQTILSNGEKASNGFEALADLDSNHDGVFDGDDEAFGEVMVWQDKNQNGIVDDDELMTLNEAGITSITLDYENQSITDINGNGHNQTGMFVKTDGTNGTITDVWL